MMLQAKVTVYLSADSIMAQQPDLLTQMCWEPDRQITPIRFPIGPNLLSCYRWQIELVRDFQCGDWQ
jgi:hypothetical protein